MSYDVKVQISTWRATAWMVAMRTIAPIVGHGRAARWAVRGVERLIRVRVGERKWSGVLRKPS